jgi:hypothetical protein
MLKLSLNHIGNKFATDKVKVFKTIEQIHSGSSIQVRNLTFGTRWSGYRVEVVANSIDAKPVTTGEILLNKV